MAQDIDSLVIAGNEALTTGEWGQARDSFRAALEVRRTAEALVGMGEALWWLGKLDESIGFREQGFAALRREPDPPRAALTALLLCMDYWKHLGNRAAATGWLARASRLVEDFTLDETRGWLLIVESETLADPASGENEARRALELARRTGDIDLELCALSQIGALLVRQSKVAEGVAYLDESMAGCLSGEGGNPDTVVLCSCNMITSCTRSAEFERVVEWVRAADRFAKRYGCPFLYAECRTYYGGTLVATGDWQQAEVELTAAIEISRSSVPEYHRQALASLAELRLVQGRIEEAERLTDGLEDHVVAAPVLARIHQLRARPAAAAATVRRALQEYGEERPESAPLLELLGELEIGHGDAEKAAERGRVLAALGAERGSPVIQARGERMLGTALAASGTPAATRHLESAVTGFLRLEMPYEAARSRLLLAETLLDTEPENAVVQARAALTAFETLGADQGADAAAALLRRLGVRAARSGPKGLPTLSKREREVLALLGEGLSNPDIADRLYLSRKTVEHHVAHVLSKLGVRGRAEAAAVAARHTERDRSSK